MQSASNCQSPGGRAGARPCAINGREPMQQVPHTVAAHYNLVGASEQHWRQIEPDGVRGLQLDERPGAWPDWRLCSVSPKLACGSQHCGAGDAHKSCCAARKLSLSSCRKLTTRSDYRHSTRYSKTTRTDNPKSASRGKNRAAVVAVGANQCSTIFSLLRMDRRSP